MKIYLHEITDVETELEVDETDAWLAQAVAQADESPDASDTPKTSRPPGVPSPHAPGVRKIRASLNLRKVDDVVVAQGSVDTHIQLLCSRCADVFQYKMSPSFSALFCQDPDMAGIAHLAPTGLDKRGPVKPVGQNKGFARHAHDFAADEQPAIGQDLDITYLSQNFIDLSDLIAEQLRLEIPFQPLCREDCKGICSTCGTDLNVGRCACAKLPKANPFSVLKALPAKAGSRS